VTRGDARDSRDRTPQAPIPFVRRGHTGGMQRNSPGRAPPVSAVEDDDVQRNLQVEFAASFTEAVT
jgi:hypothetical protein